MPALRLLIVVVLAVAASLPAAATAARPKDRDRDGLPDRWERVHRVKAPGADADRDGLSNLVELLARTNPRKRDTDRDRTPDGREDPDRDGLDNRGEARSGNHPRKRDTDGDGILDGRENAGVVTAVAGDLVTIRLFAGGSLTGRLSDETFLMCASVKQLQPAGGPAEPPAPEYFDDEAAPGDEGEDPDEDAPEAGAAQAEPEEDGPLDPAGAAEAGDDDPTATPEDRACRASLSVGTVVYEAGVESAPEGTLLTSLGLVR